MASSRNAKNEIASAWKFHKNTVRRKLVESFPKAAAALEADRLDRAIADIAFCKCKLNVAQVPNSVHARIVITPDPLKEKQDAFDTAIRNRFNDFFFPINRRDAPSLTQELATSLNDTIRTIVGRAPIDEINGLVEQCSEAVIAFDKQVDDLATAHSDAINKRDLPDVAPTGRQLYKWLLAPELSGEGIRPVALERRFQACEVYGFLWNTLMNPDVTKAIDNGKPLAPILLKTHGLRPAELKAIQGKVSVRGIMNMTKDFSDPIRLLKEYGIPLREWPEATPAEDKPWRDSEWLKLTQTTSSDRVKIYPVRPDFLESQEVKDAIKGLTEDLLIPLFRKEAPERYRYANEIKIEGLDAGRSAIRKKLIADLSRIVMGDRKLGGLKAAATLWHRRVASLAALRHERGAPSKGWPKLCGVWQSGDKRWTLSAINSAAGLVEEGNRMSHCVGGYYEECRSGLVHILSLKHDDANIATVEIRLATSDDGGSQISVTQFKGHRNEEPPSAARAAMREFLKDASTGAHPLNTEIIRKFREKQSRTSDWHHQTTSVEDARELYDFYRVLLPRGCPTTYDEWIAASGLRDAVRHCIRNSEKLAQQVETEISPVLSEILTSLGIDLKNLKSPDASI